MYRGGGVNSRLPHGGGGGILQFDEYGPARDAISLSGMDLLHAGRAGGDNRVLHLHRFEHDERLPRLHLLPRLDEDARHDAGERRFQGACPFRCARRRVRNLLRAR